MKLSPIWMAISYFIMGILFTYVAIQNVNQSGWNTVALLFTFIAALDFGLGIRYLQQGNGKGQ